MEKHTYAIVNPQDEQSSLGIVIRSDGVHIPMDEGNSDYQAYLNKDKVIDEAETI
jgi:hypothetical protein